MILNRIGTAIKRQDWFVVILEIFIVVFGVFIGLQVDDWNEERQKRVIEGAIIDRLSAEFASMEEGARFSLQFHEEIVEAMGVLKKVVEEGALREEDQEQFEKALRFAIFYRSSPDRPGTLTEILSSGQASIIQDKDLLGALIQYNSSLDRMDLSLGAIRDIQNAYMVPFGRHFSFNRELQTTVGNDTFMVSRIKNYDFEAMVADPEFQNAADNLRESQIFYYNWRVNILASIQKIRELLAKAKGDGQ